MKKLFFGVILLGIASAQASPDFSELPHNERCVALLNSVESYKFRDEFNSLSRKLFERNNHEVSPEIVADLKSLVLTTTLTQTILTQSDKTGRTIEYNYPPKGPENAPFLPCPGLLAYGDNFILKGGIFQMIQDNSLLHMANIQAKFGEGKPFQCSQMNENLILHANYQNNNCGSQTTRGVTVTVYSFFQTALEALEKSSNYHKHNGPLDFDTLNIKNILKNKIIELKNQN